MKTTIVIIFLLNFGLLNAADNNSGTASENQGLAQQLAKLTVTIKSTKDGTPQKALFYAPEEAMLGTKAKPAPLLVALHTWSSNYEQSLSYFKPARERHWVFVAPDFRGPNRRPEACASDLAVQDVLDAVEFAKKSAQVDNLRIYLIGGSGGGHMSLVMAARAPQVWAGVSAWCPITDLAAWHAENRISKRKYDNMLELVCGGAPSKETEAQYRSRSPLFRLEAAKDLPLDINAGIHDGHTGSVPVSHTLRAFNVVATANGHPEKQIVDSDIGFIVREQRTPTTLAAETQNDPDRQKTIRFRRTAGSVRVTLFDGGHDQETRAGLNWLSRQTKGKAADFTLSTTTDFPARQGSGIQSVAP